MNSGFRSFIDRAQEYKPTSQATLGFLVLLAVFHFSIGFLPRHRQFIPDEDAYYHLAQNVIDKGVYALDVGSFHQHAGAPNTYYAPAWPGILAAGYALLHTDTAFWLVSGIAWTLAMLALSWLSKALNLSPFLTAATLLWFTLNPFLVYYHLHLMTETLAVLLMSAMLACGILMIEKSDWKLALLLGVLSGAGFLTRTALILVPAAIWAVAFVRSLRPRAVMLFVTFAVGFLALASPWLWRMHSVGAGFTASELKMGQNLYLYNYTEVGNPYNLRPGEGVPFPDGLEDMQPLERDRLLTRLGIQTILKRPARYALNCLRRLYYLISPVPNFSSGGRLSSLAMTCATIVFLYVPWVLLAFALWRRPSLDWKQSTLLLLLVLWFLAHITIHASVRQRLPSDLVGAVLCASKAGDLLAKRQRGDSAMAEPLGAL